MPESKFLIATLPAMGHVNPGLPLARTLVARGHQVRWYTGAKFRAKVEATGARFVPMQRGLDFDDAKLDEHFPGRSRLSGVTQLKHDMKHIFFDSMPGQVTDLEAELRDFPADVLVHDTAVLGVQVLSERVKLPYATFGISGLTTPSVDTAPFGLGLLPSRSAVGRLRNRALNALVQHVVFRDVQQHYDRVRASLGVGRDAKGRGFLASAFTPYLYLQATVEAFEYPRSDLEPQVHFIGPLPPEPVARFVEPAWWSELQSGRRVVHVTQGTASNDSAQLIAPTVEALADDDVLVVVATGGKPVESLALRGPLPKNVRVEPFIPYDRLLPHVDVMVTNGGFGGVQLALLHGVPMVAAGNTEEKPEVCNRIAWSGVGVNLKTATPSVAQVQRAVREVLGKPSYRERAMALREAARRSDAAVRAAELLEQLAATKQPVLAR